MASIQALDQVGQNLLQQFAPEQGRIGGAQLPTNQPSAPQLPTQQPQQPQASLQNYLPQQQAQGIPSPQMGGMAQPDFPDLAGITLADLLGMGLSSLLTGLSFMQPPNPMGTPEMGVGGQGGMNATSGQQALPLQ